MPHPSPSVDRFSEPDDGPDGDRREFERLVHDALAHLNDPVHLQAHPLVRFVHSELNARPSSLGRALHQALLDAVESLRPAEGSSPRALRRYRVARLRFVDGLEVRQVQDRLSLSRSAYFVGQQQAVKAIASMLLETWVERGSAPPEGHGADAHGRGQLAADRERRPKPTPGQERARTNLPPSLTSFVGREWEIAEVKRLLGTTRLLTLTGTGGCGKTRLAYEVAADYVDEYPDGAWAVELASLADPLLVPQTVASALGIREQPGQPILATLTAYLKLKHLLLVLDNCEHLLDACASLADALLRACPKLKVLATSRQALGISGETSYRVPSLSLPDLHHPPPLERLTECEAVRLFVERAVAAEPGFAVTAKNAQAVAQVCWRLDGIPLAIELAAARVRGLTVEQLAARLDDRFKLLTGGSRAALRRQQTLRATIDWSHDLLSDPERVVLRRLAVFAGGFPLEAAEAVCSGGEVDAGEVIDLLLCLVDRSLVLPEAAGEGRYRLLETIRQYAQERLLESGERAAVRDRHLEWCLALANEGAPELNERDEPGLLARLELEQDNLRAALDWSLDRDDDASVPMRLAVGLWEVLYRSGRVSEMQERLDAVLARPGGDPEVRFITLRYAAVGDSLVGNWQRAQERHNQAVAVATATGDKAMMSVGLLQVSMVPSDLGKRGEARALQEQALQLAREVGNRQWIGNILEHLTLTLYLQGDDADVRRLSEEGLAISRDLAYPSGIAAFLAMLGYVALAEGDLARARALAEESLSQPRVAKAHLRPLIPRLLGDVARAEGDYQHAEASYRASLTECREMAGQRLWTTSYAMSLAGLWVVRGRTREAARLYGAVHGWLAAMNMPVPWWPPRGCERDEAAAREALGEKAFARAWAEGQAMTLEQAVEYALRDD